MHTAPIRLLSLALSLCSGVSPALAAETVLHAADYGLVGDGVTDDGPALQAAVRALIAAPRPARLAFEAEATYLLRTGPDVAAYVDALENGPNQTVHAAQSDTYMVRLTGQEDLAVDGAGATFLIDVTEGAMGFACVEGCRNVALANLSVDYDPLPFAEGLIIAKDAAAGHVDVRVFEESDMPPLGGPSGIRDEQAYFGMVWLEGPHGPLGHHYWMQEIREAYPGSLDDRVVRAVYRSPRQRADDWSNRPFGEGVWGDGPLAEAKAGETVISLPVRGVAHRGGREVFRIRNNENIRIASVQVWSAPWMVFGATGNRGEVTFRDVHIRPKPGTRRHSTSWRDGMHITANPGRLLFERCHLEAMNDDAFNIKTLLSRVARTIAPDTIEVLQLFPLGILPWAEGDVLEAYSVGEGRLLGRRRIVRVAGTQETDWTGDSPRSPYITLQLASPIEGLAEDDRVWNVTTANPDTTIRDCVIRTSCRLQCPMTIENTEITALAWFYGESIEGPLPSNVTVRNCTLRLGRGNPHLAVAFTAALTPEPPSEPVLSGIVLENNVIDGELSIAHARDVTLAGNRFEDTGRSKLTISNARAVTLRDNRFGEAPLGPDHVVFGDEATRDAVSFEPDPAPAP